MSNFWNDPFFSLENLDAERANDARLQRIRSVLAKRYGFDPGDEAAQAVADALAATEEAETRDPRDADEQYVGLGDFDGSGE